MKAEAIWKIEFNKLPEVAERIKRISVEKITDATLTWHSCLMEMLSGTRSGRVYKVPRTKHKYYKASAPGEPPAIRTGTLRSRYSWRVEKQGFQCAGIIGNPLNYALFLERGTSRMAPRPHLSASFEKNRQKILGKITGDWLK